MWKPSRGASLAVALQPPTPDLKDRFEFAVAASTVARHSFDEDVLAGLSAPAKWLGCSWLYDTRGSQLFEQICTLPEYYLTRTEHAILVNESASIARACPQARVLVELGSGSSVKTRLLLAAFLRQVPDLTYCPIDISPEILYCSALDLLDEFAGLSIRALAADYMEGLRSASRWAHIPKLLLFLGSTIGNFNPADARSFLSDVRSTMNPQDRLLLGVDLAKESPVIEPAYNDTAGVTAAFNVNLLTRINRELGGEFDLDRFRHHAPYLPERGCVEMRLVSQDTQDVQIRALARTFHFQAGEYIHTENCFKYTSAEIQSMAAESGLEIEHAWYDLRGWFTLALLRPARVPVNGRSGEHHGDG